MRWLTSSAVALMSRYPKGINRTGGSRPRSRYRVEDDAFAELLAEQKRKRRDQLALERRVGKAKRGRV